MKRYRPYIIYFAVFAALLLLLYLLLVLCATVPNSAIKEQMWRSAESYANADRYGFSENGIFQNVADNNADQMWLNIGWHMAGDNPFCSALDTRYYAGTAQGSSSALYMTVTRGKEANADYSRYWHGTAGLLRILHLFTDMDGIKSIGMIVLILAILKTLGELLARDSWDLGLCLVVSLLWVQIWNLRLSVEYLPCFLICFGLCPLFLRWEKQGDFYLDILAVTSGTLTAFFDFLTTETVTILIPLILVIALRSRERRLGSPRQVLGMLFRCGLCWLLAYAGTFVVKWTAVSLVTGENHFLAALDSAGKRMGGAVAMGQLHKKPGMVAAIAANLSVLFKGVARTEYRLVIYHLVLILILLFVIHRLNPNGKKQRPGTAFLLLLGGVVLLRYSILANHSYLHAFFTYRALSGTILALLCALTINLRPDRKGR